MPSLVAKVLDAGIVDQLMFSINPGYDYRHGDYANGSTEERMALYRRCEADGVGISVMKPFSGGQLLEDKTSPFGRVLTRYQCIQYALDKQGVLTVLPGIRFDSEFASTEWSIVYNQSTGEARYYHRENYEKYYSFMAGSP